MYNTKNVKNSSKTCFKNSRLWIRLKTNYFYLDILHFIWRIICPIFLAPLPKVPFHLVYDIISISQKHTQSTSEGYPSSNQKQMFKLKYIESGNRGSRIYKREIRTVIFCLTVHLYCHHNLPRYCDTFEYTNVSFISYRNFTKLL